MSADAVHRPPPSALHPYVLHFLLEERLQDSVRALVAEVGMVTASSADVDFGALMQLAGKFADPDLAGIWKWYCKKRRIQPTAAAPLLGIFSRSRGKAPAELFAMVLAFCRAHALPNTAAVFAREVASAAETAAPADIYEV